MYRSWCLGGGGFTGEEGHEAVIEGFGGIEAHIEEALIECGDFDDVCEVAAGGDGDADEWDGDAHHVTGFTVEAGTIEVVVVLGVLHMDDEVEAHFFPEGADTEEAWDGDDAEPPDFHMGLCDGDGLTDDIGDTDAAEDDGIICDEGMAAFDESESDFTFSDTRGSFEEDADALDNEHCTCGAEVWGGHILHEEGGGVHEEAGNHTGTEEWDTGLACEVAEVGGEVAITCEDDGGDGGAVGEEAEAMEAG